MELEDRPELLLCHHRALDVPTRSAAPPRRLPRRVLSRLRRLPEGEVARVLLERIRLLLLDCARPLARQSTVLGVPPDPEVDVALDGVREAALDERLDERDDLRNEVGRARERVGHPEAEVTGVLEVPVRRVQGELGARAGGGVVDPVVDVGDVVDERRVVAAGPEPRPQPHPEHERARVADVCARVDGRPAEVHADRGRRRREGVDPARERVVELHRIEPTRRRRARRRRGGASPRGRERPVPPRARALGRGR